MFLETWVMSCVMLALGGGGGGLGGGTNILRLSRLLRLTRMARMLRSMPELMILIKGMVSAMRSVAFVMCLLLIIMYMFAIALTQMSRDTTMGEEYFDTVMWSIYTLWINGTLCDNLSTVAKDIIDESYLC